MLTLLKKISTIALSVFISVGLIFTGASVSQARESSDSIQAANDPKVQEDLRALGNALKDGPAPREVIPTSYGQQIIYELKDGSSLSFSYDASGEPIVTEAQAGNIMEPRVSGGADPFPYVTLNSAEQAAAVSGVYGTLIAAICAAAGSGSAGIGCVIAGGLAATVIAVIAANGVCPNGQNARVYLLTMMLQCRDD